MEGPDERYIKVVVDNFEDHLKLLGQWPSNAFKAGVHITPMNTNLQVVITNVNKQILIDPKSKGILDLEKRYGLVDVQRIRTQIITPRTS